jgi:signal transduction histidine kinase
LTELSLVPRPNGQDRPGRRLSWDSWRQRAGIGLPVLGCVLVLIWPDALPWLPILVYDLFTLGPLWLVAPGVALVGCLGRVPGPVAASAAVLGVIVGVMAWRTGRVEGVIAGYQELRDHLSAEALRLQSLNTELAERQELELRLATADERSRIAREIHDNAGHLLTRSLLQVQAMAVAKPGSKKSLEPLAGTLEAAMDTIRDSVHALRDEAVDLEASLAALGAGTRLRIAVDYQAGDLPPTVGRAFTAMARESVANTLRHSDARRVRIAVVERPGIYQLEVHDDGSTPPGPVSASGGTGMGLATIEDRARALGGASRAGFDGGFRVFVSVPRRPSGGSGAGRVPGRAL